MAAAGGLLTSLSVPPFGWWPLAFAGIGLLVLVADGGGVRRRFALGSLFGLLLYAISLWWMTSFSLPGGLFVAALEAAFTGIGLALAGRRSPYVCVPVGLVAADALRSLWPFGGLPLGGIDLGQADGPLARSVAFGGRLLLVGLTAAAGAALALLVRGRTRPAAGVAALIAIIGALTTVLPDGTHASGTRRIAVVQGGGPRGQRASDQGTVRAYRSHLAATATITQPVDLILWPEDIVDVPVLSSSAQLVDLQTIARDHHATLVAGVIEDDGPKNFLNQAVVILPDGTVGERFEKVRRVPYGEFFPLRSIIEGWGLATLPTRDAVPGTKPGIIRTPAGPFAIAISYEGFFDDRTRVGVRKGGQAIVIPTNASSYRTMQVPTQQVAAARLRALESGRWVAQAAPTGLSAVLDERGRQRARSVVERRQVLIEDVGLRTGLTPYGHTNDAPMIALLLLGIVLGWIPRRASAPRGPRPGGIRALARVHAANQ
jgi:apolipoprotein N-acyltransferase